MFATLEVPWDPSLSPAPLVVNRYVRTSTSTCLISATTLPRYASSAKPDRPRSRGVGWAGAARRAATCGVAVWLWIRASGRRGRDGHGLGGAGGHRLRPERLGYVTARRRATVASRSRGHSPKSTSRKVCRSNKVRSSRTRRRDAESRMALSEERVEAADEACGERGAIPGRPGTAPRLTRLVEAGVATQVELEAAQARRLVRCPLQLTREQVLVSNGGGTRRTSLNDPSSVLRSAYGDSRKEAQPGETVSPSPPAAASHGRHLQDRGTWNRSKSRWRQRGYINRVRPRQRSLPARCVPRLPHTGPSDHHGTDRRPTKAPSSCASAS